MSGLQAIACILSLYVYKKNNKIISTFSWFLFFSYHNDARSNTHQISNKYCLYATLRQRVSEALAATGPPMITVKYYRLGQLSNHQCRHVEVISDLICSRSRDLYLSIRKLIKFNIHRSVHR